MSTPHMTPTQRKKREAKIETRLVNAVKRIGGIALKLEVKGHVGWPDRLCILPGGLVFFVEVKTPTGRLSPQQKNKINQLNDMGQFAFTVWNNKHVDEMIMLMQAEIEAAGALRELRRQITETNDG